MDGEDKMIGFVREVAAMREAQNCFFDATPGSAERRRALALSKRLEAVVDAQVKRTLGGEIQGALLLEIGERVSIGECREGGEAKLRSSQLSPPRSPPRLTGGG